MVQLVDEQIVFGSHPTRNSRNSHDHLYVPTLCLFLFYFVAVALLAVPPTYSKDQVTYNTTLVAMRKAGLSRQALRVSESLVKPDAADPYTYCTWV